MEEQNTLLVDGVAIVVLSDKTGNWKKDTVEIYDPEDDLANSRIASLVNYIYEEGYIADRRTQVNVIDREGNARKFKS
tara:strand:+ start:231 stop:464 length:234 start_codon:yes stop_codon:yes gene_type:complete